MNQNAKITIAAVCLTAGVGLIGWQLMNRPPSGGPVGKAPFVDVATGKIYYLRQGADFKTIPPADHPTYFPVEQDESGQWVLHPRYAGGVEELLKNGVLKAEDLKVDLETNKVRAAT